MPEGLRDRDQHTKKFENAWQNSFWKILLAAWKAYVTQSVEMPWNLQKGLRLHKQNKKVNG